MLISPLVGLGDAVNRLKELLVGMAMAVLAVMSKVKSLKLPYWYAPQGPKPFSLPLVNPSDPQPAITRKRY